MNRSKSVFVALVLLCSFDSAGVVVVPAAAPRTAHPSEFAKWKSRLRNQELFLSYATPYGYRVQIRAFAEAIRHGDIAALTDFLSHTSYDCLKIALGHSYFLKSGPRIPRSALQLAAMFGQPEAVKILLNFAKAGPDQAHLVLELDDAGQSPLHMAIFLDEVSVVAEFLNFERHHPCYSQMVFAKNAKGELPLDAANRYGRLEILELLRRPPQDPELPEMKGVNDDALDETEITARSATIYVVPAMISVVIVYLLLTQSRVEK